MRSATNGAASRYRSRSEVGRSNTSEGPGRRSNRVHRCAPAEQAELDAYRRIDEFQDHTHIAKDGTRYTQAEDRVLLLFVVQELRNGNKLAWSPRGYELWEYGVYHKLINLKRNVNSMKHRFCRLYMRLEKINLLDPADKAFLITEIKVTDNEPEQPNVPSRLINDQTETSHISPNGNSMQLIGRGEEFSDHLCCYECHIDVSTEWYKCSDCPCYYLCSICESQGHHVHD